MTELVALLFAAFISVVSTFLYGGFRVGFVFVDNKVRNLLHKNIPLCRIAWGLFALNSFLSLLGCTFELYNPDKSYGGYAGAFWLLFAVSLAALGSDVAFLLGGKNGFLRKYFHSAMHIAPYIALVYVILLYGFLMPFVPFGLRVFLTVLLAAVAALFFFIRCFGAGRLYFQTRPAVFMGQHTYTVVFSTSVPTVACLEYRYRGKKYVLWDSASRIKNVGKIHSVVVPKEHLDNNTYTVRARRAIDRLPYGGLQGKKEISFTVDHFSSLCEYEVKLLTLSDWHGNVQRWTDLPVSCSALLLMGDMNGSIDCESDFIRLLLSPCSEILHGRRPVIFVRGNNDLRGFNLPDLYRRLGIEQFNYRFTLGNVHFTVLDSGEDKADDNYEYASYLDNHVYNEYALQWLSQQPKQYGTCIALAHMPTVFADLKQQKRAGELLVAGGNRLLIAGHMHATDFFGAAEEKYLPINTFIVGAASGEHPTYSVITISGSLAELKTFDFATHEELFTKELILYTE